MDAQVSVALIAAFSAIAVVAGQILSTRTLRSAARADKQQDWDRQDEVAAKAEAAAARNASLIAELNRSNSEATRVTVGKLDVIHTLVNSTLTAAMQVALDGVRRELILMERDPTSDPALVVSTKKKIDELDKIIEERNRQTKIADLQDQKAEAAKASLAVGVLSPSHPATVTAPLGDVTDRVLRGDPPPAVGANYGVIENAAAQAKAAVETVEAADKTVKAAAKTVEAMKGTKP